MSQNNDEVLVRVEGVSKKFCRSLKKSLWYGVCDIASELNPFGRNIGQSTAYENLTTIERHGGRKKEQLKVGPKGEGMGRTESKETEETAGGSEDQTGLRSESAENHLIRWMVLGFVTASSGPLKV